MEDDIQNYLTTVMFCGTPCIRIRSFYQTLSSFDEHILEFLQVSFESFLSFSVGSFLSFSIGSFLSFSIGSIWVSLLEVFWVSQLEVLWVSLLEVLWVFIGGLMRLSFVGLSQINQGLSLTSVTFERSNTIIGISNS